MTRDPPRRPSKALSERDDPDRPPADPMSKPANTSGEASPKRTRDDRDEDDNEPNPATAADSNAKRQKPSPTRDDDENEISGLSDIPEDDESGHDPENTTPPSPSTESDAKAKHQRALDGIYHYWNFENLTATAPQRCHSKAVTRDREWDYNILYQLYKLSKKTANRWDGPDGVKKMLAEEVNYKGQFSKAKVLAAIKRVDGRINGKAQQPSGSGEGDLQARRTEVPYDEDEHHEESAEDIEDRETEMRDLSIRAMANYTIDIDDLVTEDMRAAFKSTDLKTWEPEVVDGIEQLVYDLQTSNFRSELRSDDLRRELHRIWHQRITDEPGETRMLTLGDIKNASRWLGKQVVSSAATQQTRDAGDTQQVPAASVNNPPRTLNNATLSEDQVTAQEYDGYIDQMYGLNDSVSRQSLRQAIEARQRQKARNAEPPLPQTMGRPEPSAPTTARVPARPVPLRQADRAIQITNLDLLTAVDRLRMAEANLAVAREEEYHENMRSLNVGADEVHDVGFTRMAVAEAERKVTQARAAVMELRRKRWWLENAE